MVAAAVKDDWSDESGELKASVSETHIQNHWMKVVCINADEWKQLIQQFVTRLTLRMEVYNVIVNSFFLFLFCSVSFC